jgi:hypothetical protein
MHVKTDHQIVAHGNDLMRLYDGDGNALATAERSDNGWTVTSNDGETTTEDRVSAIAHMTDHALAVLPGDGYSTLVPHGLAEMP